MTPEDPAREGAIWRDFRRAQGHALTRRMRENPPPDVGIVFSSLLCLLLAVLTDPVVWWGIPSSDFIFPSPPLRLFLASLLLLPLNGWFAQHLLARWTPQDQQRPAWVRALRLGAACLIPFGGIAIAPFWRELLRRNPPWIRPRGSVHLPLRKPFPELPKRTALESVHRSEIPKLLMVIAGGLPFLMGGLMVTDPNGISGRTGAVAWNLGFHIVAFLGMRRIYRQFSYLSTGNPWIRLLPAGSWLLLFPAPVWVAGLLVFALATFTPLRGTWIGRLYSLRSDALRFPLWRQAGEAFRPTIREFSWTDLAGRPPQADALPEEGRAAAKREALARLKLLFLPFEAGLLAWWIAKATGWQPSSSTLMALLVTAVGLAFASLLLQTLPELANKLRWDRLRPLAPYLRSGTLLLPAAGCFLGILGGAGLALGEVRIVSLLLKLLAAFLSVFGAIYALRTFAANRFNLGLFIAWGFLYVTITILGAILEVSPDLGNRKWPLALLAPVLSGVAGLALAPAFLRPFTWRHVFDWRLPVGFRTALAGVGLTAVLPLGGLAEPLWIWARQRVWPRYGDADVRRPEWKPWAAGI